MTLYELTHNATVQGNIILDGFYDNGNSSMNVLMERDVDDLYSRIPTAIEDCDVTYLFCDKDGWMHIEFDAPERVRVQSLYADKWTGGNRDNDDDDVVVEFCDLWGLSADWGKEVYELLEECEEL